MKFDITEDNEKYLSARGTIILNACPGSGKTTSVAFKLSQIQSEQAHFNSRFSGIACLSFTNVAKEEIGDKFKSLTNKVFSYPHLISTIDSFINNYITLPYYYLWNRPEKRPIIFDKVDFLDGIYLGKFLTLDGKLMQMIYPPSQLKIEGDGRITWQSKTLDKEKVDQEVFDRYAKAYKKWQFDKGYINNDDSTYAASKLLVKYPAIAKALVQRFPYIIIDEAQDTSEIQYQIFDLLIKAGLKNFEMIGDPYQSLYEFREARPDLFISRYEDATKWKPIQLRDCRRSSQKIINLYSIFRGEDKSFIKSTCQHNKDYPITILRYDPLQVTRAIDTYRNLLNSGQSYQILVRGKTHLQKLGALPNTADPWKHPAAKRLVDIHIQFLAGKTKLAIDNLRVVIAGLTVSSTDFSAKKELISQWKKEHMHNSLLFEFLKTFPTTDTSIRIWSEQATKHIEQMFGIKIDLMLKKNQGKDFYQQSLDQLLNIIKEPVTNISTIHKVKGMTFNSILLILSEDSRGGNLSLSEFSRPKGIPNEKQRMIYVALSRPEELCCIAIPNKYSRQDIIDKIGKHINFIDVQ
jgi:superfamily I DNA/RNA helicase